MALQIGFSINGAGIVFDLTELDDIFVPDYATITSTGGGFVGVIDGTGSGHSATVRGSVYGSGGSIAIDLGDSGTDSNQHVFVAAGGYVGADLSTDAAGIRVYGSGSSVVNEGSISAWRGIIFSGSPAGNLPVQITNAGTVHGSQAAIISFSGNATDVSITNTGTIIGDRYSYNANFATAAERIYNTGSITGDINFQGGDDLFDNDGGTMRGLIDFGAGNDELIGGDGRERAMGGSGSDSIDFDAGKDILLAGNSEGLASDGNDDIDGGDGIDTYDAREITSRVVVNLNESRANGDAIGLDQVFNVENIRGGGTGDILVGDAGRNVIRGGAGNDAIAGLGGDDRLIGNEGNDTIRGGEGRDVMTGGDDKDSFAYNTITEIGSLNAFRDSITDFATGIDEIHLTAIDANSVAAGNQNFSFIGIGAFTGVAGQLRYVANALNQVTVVQGDINGDSVADFQLALFGNLTLAAGDFIL